MAETVYYGSFEKENGKFGFIRQDAERQNMFALSWSCTGFDGAFPPVGTRVAYEVVNDAKTGKPRAENVRPEPERQEDQREHQSSAQEGLPADNRTGTFKRDAGKWGFILQDCDQSDLFVLPHSCQDRVFPEEGSRVSYDLICDPRTGRPRADNVRLEGTAETAPEQPAEACWTHGKGGGKGGKAGRSDRLEASQDPDSLESLSRTLASVLRHRAATLGIEIRADGFASLSQVLSNNGLFRSIDQACPGSVDVIKATKVVPEQLIEAVKTIVSTSFTNGRPRFELWENDSSGTPELWIRATHKHSIAHVWKEDNADENVEPEQANSQVIRQQNANVEKPTNTVKTHVVGISRPAGEPNDGNWPEWSSLLGDDRDARRRLNQKVADAPKVEVFAISTPPRQRPNSEEQSKPTSAVAWTKDTDPWGGCKAWGEEARETVSSAPRAMPTQAGQVSELAQMKPVVASSLPSDLSKTVGRIRSFNPEKGFGFIVCDSVQGDIFLNANAIIGEHPQKCIGYPNNPAMGPEMRFDIEVRGGKPRAINASLVGESSTETTQTPQKSEASESITDSVVASRTEEEHPEYEDMRPQDILKMLPDDAPDYVFKYLENLAKAQGGA